MLLEILLGSLEILGNPWKSIGNLFEIRGKSVEIQWESIGISGIPLSRRNPGGALTIELDCVKLRVGEPVQRARADDDAARI